MIKTAERLDEQDDVLYRMIQGTHKGVSTVGEKLAILRSETRSSLGSITLRISGLDRCVDKIQGELVEVRDELVEMKGRLDGIDGRLDGIDGRLDGIDGRLDGIDGQIGKLVAHFGLG
ncbi:archaellum component FlaC [Hamadaea flava]|uniref:t-SNARE coiled-coil homology domain-containing protein n=1 Tax=Hamadaea flava TaxID=1742688 RepID=A0ABV8LJ76_9ACTN|nr:hypothetical protein [Hamadaea flava]MCP2324819.1 archaellum component FlaC [Hamadaea flava]